MKLMNNWDRYIYTLVADYDVQTGKSKPHKRTWKDDQGGYLFPFLHFSSFCAALLNFVLNAHVLGKISELKKSTVRKT